MALTNTELKILISLKQKKFRQEHGLYLIEGEHLLRELLRSPYKTNIQDIYLSTSLVQNEKNSTEELLSFIKISTHHKPQILKDKEFERFSDTVNNQGIAASVKLETDDSSLLKNDDLIVYLDNISDPGNMGTIMRNCYWYGVDKLIISENSVDIYNPKVIRASQGSIFYLNILTGAQDMIIGDYLKNDFQVYITSLKTTNYSDTMKFKDNKAMFVFGNESSGVSGNLLNIPGSEKVKIRGFSKCESLNVAVSSGIILHDYRRSLQK